MQSVSFAGAYPRYELLAADSTAASFDLLTAMNIRRLFGERIYDQPQIDIEQNQPANTRSRRRKKRSTSLMMTSAYWRAFPDQGREWLFLWGPKSEESEQMKNPIALVACRPCTVNGVSETRPNGS